MNDIKPETFDVSRRPDFRRPFSDGSMAVATSDLAASLESSFLPFQYAAPPFQAQPFPFNSHSLPNAMHNDNDILPATKMQRGRAGRKMSMNDVKPHIRSKSGSSGPPGANSAGTGPRAMSFSHTDRPFLGLQTHFENQQTNSVSPPDFPFGINLPTRWDGGVGMSLPAMSFGTTIDEAIMDSPPDAHAHLALDEELHKKQRRRECHNQVEKRRREHINAKIEELSHLLPSHYQQTDDMDDEEDEGDSPKKRKPRRNSMAKKDAGPCKGRVLSHSVQYIQDLRHANDLQANRIAQLEAMLSGTSFSPQQAQSHSQTRAQLFYSPNLQQMPPSPDANTYDQPPAWNQYSAFSPDLRSSSTSSDNRSAPGPGAGTGPLPRMRTGSEMDIQVGLGGMDLENVFQRREDGW